MTAHHVNVEGTLNLLEFAQREGESHGRPVVFVYPSSIAAYGLPDLETQAPRRARQGRRVGPPDDDVRVQQAVLRAARALLRPPLQAVVRRAAVGTRRLPLRAVPRADLGDDGALGRHLGLRAGDDPRRGQGRALRVLRAARHADPVHGDARRRRGPAAAGRRPPRAPSRARPTTWARSIPRPRRSGTSSCEAFPRAQIAWRTDVKRQGIVDSWPEDVDDNAARRDWGFRPQLDFDRAFEEYLIPTIRKRYAS